MILVFSRPIWSMERALFTMVFMLLSERKKPAHDLTWVLVPSPVLFLKDTIYSVRNNGFLFR